MCSAIQLIFTTMHGEINLINMIKTDLNLNTVALKIVTMMMEEHFNKNHGLIHNFTDGLYNVYRNI